MGPSRGGRRGGKVRSVVRGRDVTDSAAILYHRNLIEFRLVSEGFDLSAIRGVEETEVVRESRTDVLAWVRRRLPFVADPSPVTKRYTRTTPGLSEREAIRFLTMIDELSDMEREEKAEHLRRLRQQTNLGGSGGGPGGGGL